jgi:hypothetical protein
MWLNAVTVFSIWKILLYAFLFAYILWIGFGLMMALQRARDAGSLTTPAKVLGYPLLAVFIIMDAVFNFTVCTLLFLEMPKIVMLKSGNIKINNEWLATQRLERYLYHSQPSHFLNGWRIGVAHWLAYNLLDPLAPDGQHCRP